MWFWSNAETGELHRGKNGGTYFEIGRKWLLDVDKHPGIMLPNLV